MIKILHLASFIGNIGDNASHMGLYALLQQLLPPHSFTRLEIRKFYQNYQGADKQRFDQAFIDVLNSFDLVIIGGGGFLDYWHQNSQSATTLDMPPQLVAGIKVPTLVCSMGAMPNKPVTRDNIEKFKGFLSALNLNSCITVAVRNDGSVQSIARDLGNDYLQGITEILDHGYFYQPKGDFSWPDDDYIAFNITEDQLSMRGAGAQLINKTEYYAELSRVMEHITTVLNIKVVLVPHIYSDLTAINQLLSSLDDWIVRRYISVAPCIQGNAGADFIFNLYRNSRIVVGMRFHTNVCAIAMNKTVIGLQALDRIGYLHGYFDNSQGCISISGRFSESLISAIDQALISPVKNDISQRLAEAKKVTVAFYRDFFRKHSLSQ